MQDLMTRAHEQLRHEPIERRVRASSGATPIADSTRALLIWEPRRVCPSFAVPAEDIFGELGDAPLTNGHVNGVLHPGIPFSVHTAAGEPVTVGGHEGAGFRLADEDLDGYVVLDFDAFDWLEEDQPVYGHPRSPFHRIEIRLTRRPVRIELDGELVAETTRARLVYETSLPMRFYLPREDIRAELRPTSSRSYCPYKGAASWWSVGRHADLGWSYETPLSDMSEIAGMVAFWDERVEVFFDGERRASADGPIAAALRDEFGV